MPADVSTARRLGAAAVIRDELGRVLLVRHTYGKCNWELPGGFSEPNESAAATAMREVREEIGLMVEAGRLIGVYYDSEHDMLHFVFFCHPVAEGTPRPSCPEISECLYCDSASLPRPISDFTVRRVQDALSGAGASLTTIGARRWII